MAIPKVHCVILLQINSCLMVYYFVYKCNMAGFPNFSESRRLFLIKLFLWRPILTKRTYIKTNTVFGLSKYSYIRINTNIFGINSLFFYENQRFRPQGGPFVFITDFLKGVKVKFFRFISKQIPFLASVNTLVLESIKISSKILNFLGLCISNCK